MHLAISSINVLRRQCLSRGVASLLWASAMLVVLTACNMSGTNDDEPEQETTGRSEQAQPTREPGQTSVGDILDRIEAAWPDVDSIRIVDHVGVEEDGDSDAQSVSIEEVVLPDSRRVVQETNGQIVNEHIRIDDDIWMWGAFVGDVAGPEVGSAQWVTIETSEPIDDPMLADQVALLKAPLEPMYSGQISDETRALGVSEAQEEEIEGQPCFTYSWTMQVESGETIEYRLSLDPEDLPCQMVVSSGGYSTVTSFEINSDEIAIEAPEDPDAVSEPDE